MKNTFLTILHHTHCYVVHLFNNIWQQKTCEMELRFISISVSWGIYKNSFSQVAWGLCCAECNHQEIIRN